MRVVSTLYLFLQAFRVTTGTTPRSDISTVTVIVTILDSNDNSPVWTDPTPGPISLIEVPQILLSSFALSSLPLQTRPIGTDVFVVAATDADSGTNGEVSYSLPPPVSLAVICRSISSCYVGYL